MTAALILAFVLGVALNALFAGYETGFACLDRIRLRYLATEERNARAAYLLRQRENPDWMLTMLLVGTNIALIIGTLALTKLVRYEWLATVIATPVFMIFAEVMPKSVFRRHPDRLSLQFLGIIRLFNVVLAPIVAPIKLSSMGVLRALGAKKAEINPIMASEEDFRRLVDESAERGSIEREEQEMIHSIMDLETIAAKEIMVPRTDVDALPDTATREELVKLFIESGRTRIPIYHDTVDSIIGVVNVYDVLLDEMPENPDITRFLRQVLHVPDTMPADQLLQALKRADQHMAIVTDEYGGTDGLITLEDTLEEIFGEIHDEHDPRTERIQRVGPNSWVIDARVPLEDVSEALGVVIEDEEVETIGGWVLRAAGRIPQPGETVKPAGFRVTIIEGQENQITKIRLDALPQARRAAEGEPKGGVGA